VDTEDDRLAVYFCDIITVSGSSLNVTLGTIKRYSETLLRKF
jgi:hypothetical protein